MLRPMCPVAQYVPPPRVPAFGQARTRLSEAGLLSDGASEESSHRVLLPPGLCRRRQRSVHRRRRGDRPHAPARPIGGWQRGQAIPC
jgi:hypothetical protein